MTKCNALLRIGVVDYFHDKTRWKREMDIFVINASSVRII
jgi:hypothetical protein